MPIADPYGFGGLLDSLCRDPDERLAVCHLDASGAFRSILTTVADAPSLIAQHAQGDCWYGTGVLHQRVLAGRGTAADVIGVRELFADLDVKPGGLSSFADAEAVIDELASMLSVRPAAIVNSGHGLQPHWSFERDDDTDWDDERSPEWAEAQALLRRWHRLVANVAARHNGAVDNVFDLARVLRVPGTINRKDTPAPVTMTLTGGSLLAVTRLRETLDEFGVPEYPEDRERLDVIQSEPSTWTWAEETCGYVRQMTAGWAKDRPTARHPWLVSQAVRLVGARRLGCISEADFDAASDLLAKRFATLLRIGRKRSEQPGEVAGAFAWATAKAATFTDHRARQELGNHVHPGREPLAPLDAVNLAHVHATARRWFGQSYDLDVLDAVLAVTAAGLTLDGDPANLLVVGGSGATKTETLAPLTAAGVIVTSTITSEGALLSGTSAPERAANATGGLLRKIGERGVLALKDVTSILSMHREARASVLAALRETADGFWERNLGVDGGRSISWRGKCALLGAVTTAWDEAHAVVSSMGDRFLLVRVPADDALAVGQQALANTGREDQMRAELREAVGGLLQHVTPVQDVEVSGLGYIVPLANLVTWARTAVVSDYRGNVLDAHARELPTRFAKQLAQLHRGSLTIGLTESDAQRIVTRVASDSMPPARRVVLRGLLEQTYPSSTLELARQLNRPRTSVDQQLQALVALRLAIHDESTEADGEVRAWRWRLAASVDRETLRDLVAPGNVAPSPVDGQSAPTGRASTASTLIETGPSTDTSRHQGGSTRVTSAISAATVASTLGDQCPVCRWTRGAHNPRCTASPSSLRSA